MYNAKVLPILIASPGDVAKERDIVRDVIYEINYTDAFRSNLVLMPIGWETHSSPELGLAPQDQINERLVDRCYILVGIFWTKIGSPTANEVSGSVEEIKRHHSAGKPALLYFSERPVAPEMLDGDQFKRLKEFREWCQPKGLYQPFSSEDDLRQKLQRQLRITIGENSYLIEEMSRFDAIQQEQEAGLKSVSFPKIAIDMLAGAAAKDGIISVSDFIGGSEISAGDFVLRTKGTGREDAEARSAIQKLDEYGLIEERSFGSGIYFVTAEGFDALERNSH